MASVTSSEVDEQSDPSVYTEVSTRNINTMPSGDADEPGMGGRDWRFFNVIVLGISFMLIFTAFQTCSMMEQIVLEGAKNETNSSFSGNGYTSLAVIYASFASANWAAPSVVSVCGPRLSMFLGGLLYTLFIASFLKPMTWTLYVGSVLVGIGAAVIWTGQGNFLTLNSNDSTMGRNSGIFWALLQCSLLFGNLYVYFAFEGASVITAHIRTQVFIVLTSVSAAGIIGLLLLRKPPQVDTSGILSFSTSGERPQEEKKGPLQAFLTSVRMMATRDMLLLSLPFAYTGFELTFFSGVYTTSVGHNKLFGEGHAKSLAGICGMFIGAGEILGGALFGIFGKKTIRYGRDPIIMLGLIVHLVCFYLIFLNLQPDAPMKETSGATYISSNAILAVVCAFMLGFGDSSFNTQIFSILGSVYQDNSAPAFALFKFIQIFSIVGYLYQENSASAFMIYQFAQIFSIVGYLYQENSAPAFAMFKFIQSLSAGVAFFYSLHLMLQWQLLILVVTGVLGSWAFLLVEWDNTRQRREKVDRISISATLYGSISDNQEESLIAS